MSELDDLKKQIEELKAEIIITDKLLEERHRIMDEIPACPVHGNRCVPYAIEWVRRVKTLGKIINLSGGE
jgi:hypothetical protein